MQPSQPIEPSPFINDQADLLRSFPFAYHLRMRNLLITFSPTQALAMRRGFLRLRGFCASSFIAQAVAFRSAAVSPAPTFSWCGVSCVLFNPRSTRRSSRIRAPQAAR
jgi:hypothetical protein